MDDIKKILPTDFFDKSIDYRIAECIELFIGKPYISNPIEDSHTSLFRLDGFDCVTFIETVLALSISSSLNEIRDLLIKIRYYNSKVSRENRHHFTSIDWIPANMWFLSNTFSDSSILRRISRKNFYDNKSLFIPDFLPDTILCKFPYSSFNQLLNLSPENKYYLALIIGKKDWIIVDHVGFIEVNCGNTYFIHASSKHGSVVKEDFYDYIYRIQNSKLGISIFDIRS